MWRWRVGDACISCGCVRVGFLIRSIRVCGMCVTSMRGLWGAWKGTLRMRFVVGEKAGRIPTMVSRPVRW